MHRQFENQEKKTLRWYYKTSLKTDVLHLAELFYNLHNACLRLCKLDPAHSYTAAK